MADIRGRAYPAVQGTGKTSGVGGVEVIAGVTGKSIYVTHLLISVSEKPDTDVQRQLQIIDGTSGTIFYDAEINGTESRSATDSLSVNFGEYGYKLGVGNALVVKTGNADTDATVTALGYTK
jgi:hypothetical protein